MYMVSAVDHEWNIVAEDSLVPSGTRASADPSAMNYIEDKSLSKDHNS